jgi:hypothetical protein
VIFLKDARLYPLLLSIIAIAIALAGCSSSSNDVAPDSDDDSSSDEIISDDDSVVGDDDSTNTGAHADIVAKFKAPSQAKQYDTVELDASGSSDPDGKPLNYSWDFDITDGVSPEATGEAVAHAFTSYGEFTVTLLVSSTDGRTATTRQNITITESLPAYEDITLDEGNDGTIYKTPDCTGGCAGDVKKHWNMPERVVKVESSFYWNDSAWQFEYTLGTGECPDKGIPLTSSPGDSGSITISYENESGTNLQTGQWFVHVKIANPDDLSKVAQCPYTVTLRVYYEED